MKTLSLLGKTVDPRPDHDSDQEPELCLFGTVSLPPESQEDDLF